MLADTATQGTPPAAAPAAPGSATARWRAALGRWEALLVGLIAVTLVAGSGAVHRSS